MFAVWVEGNGGRNRATDLPAGCVLGVVLSEHIRTVARDVAGCVWESNWGTDILAGCVWESNWSTDLPAGCVLCVLSEHTRPVAGDFSACVGE